MTSNVCVSKRKRRVIVHISWPQWCLRPIKFDSQQNLLCTLETFQLRTALYHRIPMVPTKDFKPFIYAGVFVPICIPSKLYNLWDFLSDKVCAPLISPRPMGFLSSSSNFFCMYMCVYIYAPSCTSVQISSGVCFICTWTHVIGHVSLIWDKIKTMPPSL